MTTTTRDRLADIADDLYTAVYGHLDDKRFRDDKLGEIEDWLFEADRPDEVIAMVDHGHLDTLVAEWNEREATS